MHIFEIRYRNPSHEHNPRLIATRKAATKEAALDSFWSGGSRDALEILSVGRRRELGERVMVNGYEGRITSLYSDGATEADRMYEVKLESGSLCVCGSDIGDAT